MLAYLEASLQEKCLPYTKATSSTHIYIYIHTYPVNPEEKLNAASTRKGQTGL